MKFKFNSRYSTIAVYCIIVFTVCLALVTLVFKFNTVCKYIGTVVSVLSPVIWGICIAYLINPFMVFCERHFKKWFCRKKDRHGLTRSLAIIVSMIVFFGLLVGIIGAIIPEIKDTLMDFFKSLPSYITNLQNYLENLISDFVEDKPQLEEFINNKFSHIQDFVKEIGPYVDGLFSDNGIISSVTNSVTDSVFAVLTGLKNFLLGIFVSIYLLYSKEMFLAQITKAVHALFTERKRKTILKIASRTNKTFTSFLTGKTIDSLIIGLLAFIGLEIMGLNKYAVLLSIIIGITNMIPFFGPIIGAIPCALLILLTSPDKTIIFIIFVLLLQQFDGNILGPKILGNSLGLSPFWIMFAIFVGGGLFGLVGMIAFVPIFAVIYGIVNEVVTTRLKAKGLPLSTDNYVHERTEPTIKISPFKTKKRRKDTDRAVESETENEPEKSDDDRTEKGQN